MLGFDALHRVPMKQHKSRNSVLEFEVAEEQPLLQQHGLYDAQSDGSTTTTGAGLSSRQLMGVYFSHFLSTWNSRCNEFAAVSVLIQLAAFWRGMLSECQRKILFTASAYPGTLAASSLR